ncbi:MAG: carboxypeptidase-like regulatory domain-containing protein [Bacteroidia bacterium]
MNQFLKYYIIILAFCFSIYNANCQTKPITNENELVQLSGFIVSFDSTQVLPYVTVRIEGTNRGVFSDMSGFFSLVCKQTDKIVFSALGQKKLFYTLPNNIEGNKLTTVIRMEEDTFFLRDVVIRPYSTPQELDYYFARAKIPNSNLSLAYENLGRVSFESLQKGILADGAENGRWYQQAQAEKLYYNGQPQPIPIADIGTWYRFLNSLGNKKKK